MAHTSWLTGSTKALGLAWHPCWTQGFNEGPWPLTGVISAAPCHPQNYEDPGSSTHQALRHKTRDVWKYGCGLASTAQDLVLNRQCGLLQTNGYTTRVHQSIYRLPRAGGSLANISHTKRFSHCIHT